MLVRPTRAFPGTLFLLRGTALAQIAPTLLLLILGSTVLVINDAAWGVSAMHLSTVPFSLVGLALSIFFGI